MLKKKMLLRNLSLLCRTQNRESNTADIVIQICPLVDDKFWLPSITETQTVCHWIKLKRWAQSFPGSRHEPFWKIKIFYISSIKIRYCYSSQVDPECSGWSNTIAAFFCWFFIFLTFFSTFLFFSFHLSLHIAHNHTRTHTHTHTNL